MYKELFAVYKDNIGLGSTSPVKLEEKKETIAINQSVAVSPKQNDKLLP